MQSIMCLAARMGTCLGCFGVQDVHWVPPTRYPEDGCIVKVLRELLSIQCGTGDEQLQIRSKSRNILDLHAEYSARYWQDILGSLNTRKIHLHGKFAMVSDNNNKPT